MRSSRSSAAGSWRPLPLRACPATVGGLVGFGVVRPGGGTLVRAWAARQSPPHIEAAKL